MESLKTTLLELWRAFVKFFENVVLTIYDMLKDLFFWLFDTLLEFAVSMLNIVFTPLNSYVPTKYINALPSDILNIMGLIGMGEAVKIIIAAILIRITLQLIPFTRLGS